MPAKKKNAVQTPLHLLQELSHSLIEHLQDACEKAEAEAEKTLAKLDKQHSKAQARLHDARCALVELTKAGKAKAQAKAKAAVDELEELLVDLQKRQVQTRSYLQKLKSDAEQSLKLAEGVHKVRDAAAKALGLATDKPAAKATPARAAAKPAAPRAAKPATATRPAARKPAATPAAPAAAAPTPATSARKPASRRPRSPQV